MGRTSREKFDEQERHSPSSIFDEVDRELRRSRRRVVWPYIVAGLAIGLVFLLVFLAEAVPTLIDKFKEVWNNV